MGALGLVLREVERKAYAVGDAARAAAPPPAGSAGVPAGTPGAPATDRTAEREAVEALGDEIALLAAHGHAANHRLLVLIARFDRLEGWRAGGHRSCAHWLAFRTGMDLHTAREHVRVARALETLPETSASMGRGRLSFSKVRALTRVATPESETDLLELAEGSTATQLERACRAWKKGTRRDEAALEREHHRLRRVSVFPDGEGTYLIRGRLEPEVGALLMRAIEAASDALYREEREATAPASSHLDVPAGTSETPESVPAGTHSDAVDTSQAAARRRHDALALLAERALAAGFGSSAGASSPAPISGTRAERYQVLLHVDPDTLSEDREPGRSELEDGTRLSAETARRLSCDAAVVRVQHGADGSTLDVGRRTRSIPPALRRALEVRDRGCRFPGCGLRFTDAHHIAHWADGGQTSLENTVLLCRFHHRLVHEGGWRLEWWGKGRAVFRDPEGGHHFDPEFGEGEPPRGSLSALLADNRRRGVDPRPMTPSARWKRERDIPDEVWFRAIEAAAAPVPTSARPPVSDR